MMQCLSGIAIGLISAVLLLVTNVAGLKDLIVASADPVTMLAVFLAGGVMTIAPMVMATAIGLLAYDEERRSQAPSMKPRSERKETGAAQDR